MARKRPDVGDVNKKEEERIVVQCIDQVRVLVRIFVTVISPFPMYQSRKRRDYIKGWKVPFHRPSP